MAEDLIGDFTVENFLVRPQVPGRLLPHERLSVKQRHLPAVRVRPTSLSKLEGKEKPVRWGAPGLLRLPFVSLTSPVLAAAEPSQSGGRGPGAPHNGADAPLPAGGTAAPSPSAARDRRTAGSRDWQCARRGAEPAHPGVRRPRTDPGRRRALFPVPRDARSRAPHLRAPARRRTFPRGSPRGPGPPRPGVSPSRRRRRSCCHCRAPRGDRVPPTLPRLSALLGSF